MSLMLFSQSRRVERCRNARSRTTQQRRGATLTLELLEDRCLLSGTRVAHGHDAVNLIDPIRGFGHKHRDHVAWSSSPGAPATVGVFIHDHSGNLTADQAARMREAIAELNRTWDGSQGLQLVEIATNAQAKVHVHNDTTSGCGGRSQGVLGCAEYSYFISGSGKFADGHFYHRFAGQAEVTMISGWSWYAGSALPVPAGQYDYQTVATQELAHVVGLDHDSSNAYTNAAGTPLNGDGHSAMYPSLVAGHAHRQLSDHDLASLRHLYAFGPNPDSGSGSVSSASQKEASGDHDTHAGDDHSLPPTPFSPPVVVTPDRLPASPVASRPETLSSANDLGEQDSNLRSGATRAGRTSHEAAVDTVVAELAAANPALHRVAAAERGRSGGVIDPLSLLDDATLADLSVALVR